MHGATTGLLYFRSLPCPPEVLELFLRADRAESENSPCEATLIGPPCGRRGENRHTHRNLRPGAVGRGGCLPQPAAASTRLFGRGGLPQPAAANSAEHSPFRPRRLAAASRGEHSPFRPRRLAAASRGEHSPFPANAPRGGRALPSSIRQKGMPTASPSSHDCSPCRSLSDAAPGGTRTHQSWERAATQKYAASAGGLRPPEGRKLCSAPRPSPVVGLEREASRDASAERRRAEKMPRPIGGN